MRPWLHARKRLRACAILGHFIRQELEGDKAAEFDVFGLVDDSHPATAELLDDAVVRDGLADHWAEILGPEIGQVNETREVGCLPEAQLAKNRHYTH